MDAPALASLLFPGFAARLADLPANLPDTARAAASGLAGQLGWASLRGALAVALVAAVCRLFPRLPAGLRCGLWWLVSLSLLVGLAWTSPVTLAVLPAPAPAAVPAPLDRTAPGLAGDGTAARSGAGPVLEDRGEIAGAPSGPALPAAWGPPALLVLWGAGVLAGGGAALRQLGRTRRLLRRASPVQDPALAGLFEELRGALGLQARARLLASSEVATPQVLGVLRPAVLLPAGQLARLGPGDLAMTLCHELLHVRRGDLWLGWVPALAERLFFFHPLARLAVREYALAREAACDAGVLRVLAPAPEDYGRLLLKLGVTPRATAFAAAGAAPSLQSLKRRLEMLQQTSDKKRLHPAVWALVGLAAVAALVPFRMVAEAPAEEAAPAAEAAAPASASAVAVPGLPAVQQTAVVAQAQPTPPTPPTPPAPPTPPRRSHWSSSGDSFVLLHGRGNVTMSGSGDDVRRARRVLGDTGIWFERDGKAYVITDPELTRQAQALFEPQTELGERQAQLGEQQARLGEQQAKLGEQMARLGGQMGELGAQVGEMALRSVGADGEEDPEVERKMEDLEDRMEALGREMEKHGEPMEELGRQQEALGRQQEELGRQQEKLAQEAEQKLQALLDRAVADGRAKPANDR